jgi:hypothetical protein
MRTVISLYDSKIDGLRQIDAFVWLRKFKLVNEKDKPIIERNLGNSLKLPYLTDDTVYTLYKSLNGDYKIIPHHALIEMGIDVVEFANLVRGGEIDVDIAINMLRL